MKPDYQNWVPKNLVTAYAGICLASGLGTVWAASRTRHGVAPKVLTGVLGVTAAASGFSWNWCLRARAAFDYAGERQLSRQMVDGIAEYVKLPEGGVGLDVGCGSGALTIACAKSNPKASMLGIDRWGPEYACYSQQLCEHNAIAEEVENIRFEPGNALQLDFPDETFDAVTSNYVYHNITGANKQALLRETLRVLKKGGVFAIHDLMSKLRYGDMVAFAQELKDAGYEDVQLIDTTQGMFMSPEEARSLFLTGSTLLVGRK